MMKLNRKGNERLDKEKEFQGEARKSVKIGSVPQLTGHGLEEGEKKVKRRLESKFLAMTERASTNGRAEDRRGKREGVDDQGRSLHSHHERTVTE